MVRFALALALAIACPAAPALGAGAEPLERLRLLDRICTSGWQAVGSTLTPAFVQGERALLFRVRVDWKAGEPNYPVGWPRIQTSLRASQGDWRKWGQIHLRVLPRRAGKPFPYQALGITISSGERNVSWEKDCAGLQADSWQEFTFSLRDVPDRDQVKSLGVFISESEYSDGEVLDFCISDLELVRYAQPTLVGLTPLASVAFADARALPLVVDMLGVQPGAAVPVEICLSKAETQIAAHTASATEGETQISLPLPASGGLAPGEYTLTARADGRTLSHSITLIASPWREVNK